MGLQLPSAGDEVRLIKMSLSSLVSPMVPSIEVDVFSGQVTSLTFGISESELFLTGFTDTDKVHIYDMLSADFSVRELYEFRSYPGASGFGTWIVRD